MKTWHAVAGVLVIFLAGVMAGAAGARVYARHRIEQAIGGGPEGMRKAVMFRLSRELGLSAEQRGQIEPIVEDAQARIAKLRAVYQPEVEKIVADSINRMQPALTPEQNTKLQGLFDKIQERWKTAPGVSPTER